MLKKLKLSILWALFFTGALTLVFRILFNFDLWSIRAWHTIARIRIYGLSGLAFGALLLSAVPVMLASIRYIWKNGKLPFSPPAKKKKTDEKKTEDSDDSTPKQTFPDNMPDEMKELYIRINSGQRAKQTAAFFAPKTDTKDDEEPTLVDTPDAFMPLPESFDSAQEDTSPSPTFTEIKF